MQLYTVRMTSQHKVSKFDAKGKKIAEEVKEIPVTFTDLPLSTAQMYRDKNPAGSVQIIAQPPSSDRGSRPAQQRSFETKRAQPQSKPKAAKPVTNKRNDAARTGDMAAAISN